MNFASLNFFTLTETCDDIDISCYSGIGCVDKALICDDVRHCLDGSDEWGCCKYINTSKKVTQLVFICLLY